MRYSTNKIKNKKYLTSRLNQLPISEEDKYIISRQGDRLDLLANEFYNNVDAWWIIADANNLGKGDLIVPPGIQLRIPAMVADIYEFLLQNEENR